MAGIFCFDFGEFQFNLVHGRGRAKNYTTLKHHMGLRFQMTAGLPQRQTPECLNSLSRYQVKFIWTTSDRQASASCCLASNWLERPRTSMQLRNVAAWKHCCIDFYKIPMIRSACMGYFFDTGFVTIVVLGRTGSSIGLGSVSCKRLLSL